MPYEPKVIKPKWHYYPRSGVSFANEPGWMYIKFANKFYARLFFWGAVTAFKIPVNWKMAGHCLILMALYYFRLLKEKLK